MCVAIYDVEQTPFHPFFAGLTQIFQRRKSDANKQDFENKFNPPAAGPVKLRDDTSRRRGRVP